MNTSFLFLGHPPLLDEFQAIPILEPPQLGILIQLRGFFTIKHTHQAESKSHSELPQA